MLNSSRPYIVYSRYRLYIDSFIASLVQQCSKYILNQYSPNSISLYNSLVMHSIILGRYQSQISLGKYIRISYIRKFYNYIYTYIISLNLPFILYNKIRVRLSARRSLQLIRQIIGDQVRIKSFLSSAYPQIIRRVFLYSFIIFPLTSYIGVS